MSSPDSTTALWSVSITGTGLFPPADDTSFTSLSPSTGRTFTNSGAKLYSFDNVSGSMNWGMPKTFGSTIQNFVIPIVLTSAPTSEFIFLANSDGNLYKVDASNGGLATSVAIVSPGDQLLATPSLWIYRYSNSTTFKRCVSDSLFNCPGSVAARHPCTPSKPGQNPNCYCNGGSSDDLVFVITDKVDTTDNEVFALCASDLTYFWQYHPKSAGDGGMNYASDGAYVDYDNNAIYFGTKAYVLPNPVQGTLWSVNAITGQLNHQQNLGAISTRPQFSITNGGSATCGATCPFLFVGTDSGMLKVINTSTWGSTACMWGTVNSMCVWQQALASTHPFKRSTWKEFRTGGYGSYLINSVDDADPLDGNLVKTFMKVVVDHSSNSTPSGSLIWGDRVTLAGLSGMGAVDNEVGKAYVGTANSVVKQFEMSADTITSIDDATATVSTSGSVGDVTLDSTSGSSIDRVTVNVGGATPELKRYCIPWTNGDATSSSLPFGPDPDRCSGEGCASYQPLPPPQPMISTPCTQDADCEGTGTPCSTTCTNCPSGSCTTTEAHPECQCPGQGPLCSSCDASNTCNCFWPGNQVTSCTCVGGRPCTCPPPKCSSCPAKANGLPQYCDGHGACRTEYEGARAPGAPPGTGGCKMARCKGGVCYAGPTQGIGNCTNGDPTVCDPAYVSNPTGQPSCDTTKCPTDVDGVPLCSKCFAGSVTCEGLFTSSCTVTGGGGCTPANGFPPGQVCCSAATNSCSQDSLPHCADTEKDSCNCGGCNIVCSVANSRCESGTCQCSPGLTDCPAGVGKDGNPFIGTCQPSQAEECLQTTGTGGPSCNCGACGAVCGTCCITNPPTNQTVCCPRGVVCFGQLC
jgi:hypothetical protein